MAEPLLRIRNHHSAGSGDPPTVSGDDPAIYIGYFENAHGEQWIFTYNRATKSAELRGGDTAWKSIFYVRAGNVAELVLSRDEQAWLTACWHAATGG
jgi:hypothetical protein